MSFGFAVAQLRHLYVNLLAEGNGELADKLLSPAIVAIEEQATALAALAQLKPEIVEAQYRYDTDHNGREIRECRACYRIEGHGHEDDCWLVKLLALLPDPQTET